MAAVTVPDLTEDVVDRLKRRAEGHRRSLEAELRAILEQAARQVDLATARREAAAMRESLVGRIGGDSADLIRADRDQ